MHKKHEMLQANKNKKCASKWEKITYSLVFLYFCLGVFVVPFVLLLSGIFVFVPVKSFCKKIKRFKVALMTPFTLLLPAFSNILLGTFISNLISLTRPSLHVSGKTQTGIYLISGFLVNLL